MSTSNQKGNITLFLELVAVAVVVLLAIILGKNMLFSGTRQGKYSNPNVAATVVQGTIYDRNNRALSLQTPVYDRNNELEGYIRNYPSSFHACQIISEVEHVLSSYITPHPGYNEVTTYGNDIYLTIDSDIQYFTDLATQQLYNTTKSEYTFAMVLDANTSEVLACSTCPFYDLNENNSVVINKAFRSVIEANGTTLQPYFISSVKDKQGNIVLDSSSIDYKAMGFTVDYSSDVQVNTQTYCYPKTNPKYVVYIGIPVTKSSYNSEISKTLDILIQGLESQGKL